MSERVAPITGSTSGIGVATARRPAKSKDIADLVAALCANDYVSGEIVIADGGLNLTRGRRRRER